MAISRLSSNRAHYAAAAVRAQGARAVSAARFAANVGWSAARETARVSSYMEPTLVLTAADAGDGTATVTIAAHRRVYPVEGSIKVPDVELEAAALTGAPLDNPGVAIFYVDPTLADPTPTFQFSDNPADAQVGVVPGMHLVGIIPTPAAGAPATTGTAGSAPPGYNRDIEPRSTE